jgi:phage terminase large subunit-like protein
VLSGFDEEAFKRLPPAEQAEVSKILAQLDELRRQNPLAFFHPHGRQEEFLSLVVRVKLFLGGNRSGKTTCGVVDDLIQAVDRSCLPDHLLPFKRWEPPFFAWIVVPSFDTLDSVLLQKIREWAPKSQLHGGDFDSAYEKQRKILRFKNGSWFAFKTFEQDVDKFSGAALHRVHFDEEPPEPIFNECLMRLIDYDGEAMFTMTPLLGLSWVFDRLYERRHEGKDIRVVEVDMDDNPHLNEAAKEAALEGLSDEERVARKEGRFVHFAGMVFPEFKDRDHVVDPPKRSALRGQSIVLGIDPGIRWTGVSFVAFDDDNAALVFDELYLEQHTVPQVVAAIEEKLGEWGVRPDFYVIDPSARNRTQINADAVEAEFQRHGVFTVHGQNDREAGILTMKRRLQGDPPSLLLSRDCARLIREFGLYRYDPKAENEFAVLKVNDHVLDATRYALMSRAWGVVRPPDKPLNRKGGYNPAFEDPWTGSSSPRELGPLGV